MVDRLESRLSGIVEALAGPGWCAVPGLVAPAAVEAIASEARGLLGLGRFRPAGVGRGAGLAERPEIRGDRICWVDRASAPPAIGAYLDLVERLRLQVNRGLSLGLFELEAHLAIYPPGAFYRRHLDRHRGVELRTLTCLLYLNADWQPEDGGTLRIYTDPNDPERFAEVAPRGGTFATFLSGDFEHEVMPARRERLSLTGWLKRRGPPLGI
jgi:SM-20-related protein